MFTCGFGAHADADFHLRAQDMVCEQPSAYTRHVACGHWRHGQYSLPDISNNPRVLGNSQDTRVAASCTTARAVQTRLHANR
jgi:hypothetical protein